MKRLLALMVVGCMTVIMTGCGQDAPKQPEVKTETVVVPASEKPADAEKEVKTDAAAPAAQE